MTREDDKAQLLAQLKMMTTAYKTVYEMGRHEDARDVIFLFLKPVIDELEEEHLDEIKEYCVRLLDTRLRTCSNCGGQQEKLRDYGNIKICELCLRMDTSDLVQKNRLD